jgi:membrane protein required for colicin V production
MVVDIIFAAVVVYGFYVGFTRGIIRTVFAVISIVVGLLAAFKFSPAVTNLLENQFGEQPLLFILGFALTFAAAMLLIRMLARGMESVLRLGNINFINQAAGGVFLAAVMVLLYSVILWFGDQARIINQETKRSSMVYRYLEDYPTLVWNMGGKLRPIVEDFWDYTVDFLDRMQEYSVERTENNPSIYDKDESEEDDDIYLYE